MNKKFIVFIFITIFNIQCYGQLKIVLKMDDLVVLNGKNSFQLTTDYLVEKKIKSSLGIIGNRVDAKSKSVLLSLINLRDNDDNDVFEFWNHGYDHIIPEYQNHNYEYQKQHFENANEAIRNVLGIQMNTFGAPGNAVDSLTTKVVKENSDYHVFFFNSYRDKNRNTNLLDFNQRVDMENGTGKVNYDFFVKNYLYYKKFWKDYMVLQGHPNSWNIAELEEFKRIIEFLENEKVDFVLPNDLYLSSKVLNSPIILNGQQMSDTSISIQWKSTDQFNNLYRIERSIDQKNWKRVNTQYSKAGDTNVFLDDLTYSFANRNVYYRIKVNGDLDNSQFSNIVKVELEETGSFCKILANPFQSSLDIKFKFHEEGSYLLALYDIEGKLISNFNTEYYTVKDRVKIRKFDTNDLPVGVYFSIFTFNGQQYKAKVIKK